MTDTDPETETGTAPAWTIRPGIDSYCSLAEGQATAATRLFAGAWNSATEVAQSQALVTATALLDRMHWQGRPLAPTQTLAWPRVAEGYPLTAAMPPAIVTACVELAIHLLTQGQLPGAPVMQRMLGDSMTMYFPTIADEMPKHVRRLIEPFLRVSSANVAEVTF